jgi:DNA modification methylase
MVVTSPATERVGIHTGIRGQKGTHAPAIFDPQRVGIEMPIADQILTDRYALYCGDAMEVLPTLPAGAVHLSIYSPPFATEGGGALYHYSSSPRDLSNARTYQEFWRHYAFIVRELFRVTMPGRMACVHCTDIPSGNTGNDHLVDFPGQIIRLHRKHGWWYVTRYHVWKEPLTVRNRTMTKSLAHQQIVQDSSRCTVASADYLLVFRRKGVNPVPIAHQQGLTEYAGEREMPAELLAYRNWKGKQTENRYSHWIWRQYASAFWDDVRIDRVLPFKQARDEEDEKHVHPLQLDVIDRCLHLWSNPGEVVLSPFAGVGSEVYAAVRLGRKGVGVELKSSYYRQMVKNVATAESEATQGVEQAALFAAQEAPCPAP